MVVQMKVRRGLVAVVLLCAAAFPVSAQAPELAMLDALAKGSWEFRARQGQAPGAVCVRSGRELIQIRHRQTGCSQFLVDDQPNVVTVQYTCRGDGYGRTTIRREDSRLVQIRSQGMQGGMPFTFEGEARQTGPC